jgi:hypothetical protein
MNYYLLQIGTEFAGSAFEPTLWLIRPCGTRQAQRLSNADIRMRWALEPRLLVLPFPVWLRPCMYCLSGIIRVIHPAGQPPHFSSNASHICMS